jgi:hypothetical protein
MWGAVPMIVEGMYPGTRTIGRANRFSAISPVTNAFSGEIQTDLSFTPQISFADSSTFFKRYARMYSSQEYSGSE